MQFFNRSAQKREIKKDYNGEKEGTVASLPVDSGFLTPGICIGKVRMRKIIENATASA
jgi:hypothetical protein